MKILFLSISLCLFLSASSQTYFYDDPKFGASLKGIRYDTEMQKWRESRFGLFLHFGLYSVTGGSWMGKQSTNAAEWLMNTFTIPKGEYANKLIPQFNPVLYNADKWSDMAKVMGVKYVTITTKHHEGFCLWPTKYTDFNVSATPYKKDLLKSFVQAFLKRGINVNFYYSIMDWHHPDYRSDIKTTADMEAFQRYMIFVKNQIDELLTNYPGISVLWFDGQWDDSYKKNPALGLELEKFIRTKYPKIILNNRVRSDYYGNLDYDYNKRHYGDYDATWERRTPRKEDNKKFDFDWECGQTIPENQWGYHKYWTGHIKTANEVIETLALCTSLGGNFMINFGPQPNGDFRVYEKRLAKDIGKWLQKNGNAIYGCGDAGLQKQDWGYYTQNKNDSLKLNMIVFNYPISKLLKVKLPDNTKIRKASIPEYPGSKIIIESMHGYEGSEYLIKLNRTFDKPFVIVLNVDLKQQI